MSVFVVNVETIEGTNVLGVYLSDKLAKAAAKDYVDSKYSDKMKKKQVNKESDETRKVLFVEDVSENPVVITMSKVVFDHCLPQKKAKKDPLAPKKGLSAYMIFAKESRSSIKTDNPDATFGELGKLIGNSWKKLSEDEKKPFNIKAENDKKRYENEVKQNLVGKN